MNRIKYKTLGILLVLSGAVCLHGCNEPEWVERTNFEILIGEYFENHPDSFSVFVDLLKKSETLSFLKAYGTYTCFAPTNEAFGKYFSAKGISGLDAMNVVEMKDLVRYCVIQDTLSSETFVDGRMVTPTLLGQYLTYGTYFEGGKVVGKINKKAVIGQMDIRVLNGIVHIMDDVLEPEPKSIALYVESLEGYSIFTEALKKTGLYDSLNILPDAESDTVWITLFAVPDVVYKEDGIQSFDDLKARYQTEERPGGLIDYMAYHILHNQYLFVTDLISSKVVSTKVPSEVLTIRTSGQTVLVNDDIFAGIHEPGYEIDRALSDQTAANGVIHFMKGNFFIKVRYPFAVYWDVCEQMELMKMPGVFRKAGAAGLQNGQMANVSWENETTTIDYNVGAINGVSHHAFNDYFYIYFRPEIVKSIKLVTPTLVKGFYNIWFCARTQTSSARQYRAYVYFNGEQTTRIIDGSKAYGSFGGNYITDGQLNLNGFKIYQYNPADYVVTDVALLPEVIAKGRSENWLNSAAWSRYAGQLAGTVEVKETGPQSIEFIATAGGNGSYMYLDMIQFIPVDEDQNWPRINVKDGTFVYKEDLEKGNFPQ